VDQHDLCVVIVADRGDARLGSTLCGLLARAGWLDLDVVVADNGDGEASSYVEDNFIDVRTIDCAGRGVGYASNRALETTNARYLLFADPALEMCEGSLSTIVAALDRQPGVGLAGVRRVRSDGSVTPALRRYPLDWTSGLILVRRTALENSGWFDERFFAFAEKADLCMRLQRRGWEVISMPSVAVRSLRSWRHESRPEAHAAHARLRFVRKRFPRLAADYRWALAVRHALRLGLYSLRPRRNSGRRQGTRAALDAVFTGRTPASFAADQPGLAGVSHRSTRPPTLRP
jgi:N-acetylglucosaminyl-diphospho-decaprenol L-rhamnosyltransferase